MISQVGISFHPRTCIVYDDDAVWRQTHLAIVTPDHRGWWIWSVFDEAGQVDSASFIHKKIRRADYYSLRFCNIFTNKYTILYIRIYIRVCHFKGLRQLFIFIKKKNRLEIYWTVRREACI